MLKDASVTTIILSKKVLRITTMIIAITTIVSLAINLQAEDTIEIPSIARSVTFEIIGNNFPSPHDEYLEMEILTEDDTTKTHKIKIFKPEYNCNSASTTSTIFIPNDDGEYRKITIGSTDPAEPYIDPVFNYPQWYRITKIYDKSKERKQILEFVLWHLPGSHDNLAIQYDANFIDLTKIPEGAPPPGCDPKKYPAYKVSLKLTRKDSGHTP